ncbi:glucose-6-phosphate dehydrogenase [Gephyromycinifex aptenodytis]|uniref:glucose-6-phosphate dehydrogenase n=1 Tax=Gephyromycinifex aptenodytis TaxID=2716227 RepID=UPI0014457749|nr:glucose-6-phosphate dehydrogenase [Gephyromycinifex aptenodytis]
MTTSAVTLAILGASGDLTSRLLLPGMATLLVHRPDLDVALVGAAAEDLSKDEWQSRVKAALSAGGCQDETSRRVLNSSRYTTLDVTDQGAMRDFIASLPTDRPIVLYFALPPSISEKACQVLSGIPLPEDIRLAIEKPFGVNRESAHRFNHLLTSFVREEQIFRVDHFLGRDTVLNLLGLRFGNRVLSRVWTAVDIESIEIVYDEELALEGRAGYYDKAGALKDMLQSHLLLVMAMLMMEEPARVDALELRDLMTHTLRATHLLNDDPVAASRRARYTAGKIRDREIPSYVDEPGVDAARNTETLSEITVEVRNARWTGVPITLRSGKALCGGQREMVLTFRPVAHVPEGFADTPTQDVLRLGMHPETLSLTMTTSGAEGALDFSSVDLKADLGDSPVRPYGEILSHIIDGDPLLSVRGDMAEECWRIVDPVLAAWADGSVPLDEYPAGSTGPANWS